MSRDVGSSLAHRARKRFYPDPLWSRYLRRVVRHEVQRRPRIAPLPPPLDLFPDEPEERTEYPPKADQPAGSVVVDLGRRRRFPVPHLRKLTREDLVRSLLGRRDRP